MLLAEEVAAGDRAAADRGRQRAPDLQRAALTMSRAIARLE
jgi:hypothetical protein